MPTSTTIVKREYWYVTNGSSSALSIGDLPKLPTLDVGKTYDMLLFHSKADIEQSVNLAYVLQQGWATIVKTLDNANTDVNSGNVLTELSAADIADTSGGGGSFLPLAGGTMAGYITMAGYPLNFANSSNVLQGTISCYSGGGINIGASEGNIVQISSPLGMDGQPIYANGGIDMYGTSITNASYLEMAGPISMSGYIYTNGWGLIGSGGQTLLDTGSNWTMTGSGYFNVQNSGINANNLIMDGPISWGGSGRVNSSNGSDISIIGDNINLSAVDTIYANTAISMSGYPIIFGSGSGYYIKVNTEATGLETNGTFALTPQTVPLTGAVEGQMYYDSGAHALKIYNGTAWKTVTMT